MSPYKTPYVNLSDPNGYVAIKWTSFVTGSTFECAVNTNSFPSKSSNLPDSTFPVSGSIDI